nr:ogr/Delta-like zinc finger family protein [Stutzerimonas balearica]
MSRGNNVSVYKLVCPACGERMRIRNSEGQTPTFRTIYGQCMNLACGLVLTGSMSWDYQINTSGMDKPRVVLPIAPSVAKMQALRDSRPASDQPDLFDQPLKEAHA